MLHQNFDNFQSSKSRSGYRCIYPIVTQNDRIEYAINQPDRTARKVFNPFLNEFRRSDKRQPAKSGHWTHWFYRWLTDRITSLPHNQSLSRLADRLLLAIESRGGQDNV